MGRGRVTGFVSTMGDFATFLGPFAGKRVIDDTGLVGPFALSTAFDPRSETDASPMLAEKDLPSLRDALKTDLGFTLEPGGQRDFPILVVEHVEQPTPN